MRFNRIYEWLIGCTTVKAPTSDIQHPEKHQIPKSKARKTPFSKGGERETDPSEFLVWLENVEAQDNLFPMINYRYWFRGSEK